MNEPPARDRKIEQHDHLLRFWAKTSHDPEAAPNAFHPLICHMIDVACVAEAIWDRTLPEVARLRLARPFGLENDIAAAGKFIAFLAGLHDLGKCSPPFAMRGWKQDKAIESLRKQLRDEGDKLDRAQKQRILSRLQSLEFYSFYSNTEWDCKDFEPNHECPHGYVTALILPAMLCDRFKMPVTLAQNLADIIGGHHGTFASSTFTNVRQKDDGPFYIKRCGGHAWRLAQRQHFDTLADLLFPDADFSPLPDGPLTNADAMILAGLVSVSDWIGSNTGEWIKRDGKPKKEDLFVSGLTDYHAVARSQKVELDLDAYAGKSAEIAKRALNVLGWSHWPKGEKSNPRSFEQLFPKISAKRDLQRKAVEIADSLTENDLGICVIEAPMGEGKTETAMYLAEAFNSKLGTRGIYFALPTQATSDQMFGRVREFLEKRFEGEEDLNVQVMLAHGHASLSEEFNEHINSFEQMRGVHGDEDAKDRDDNPGDEQSNVAAAEWFTYKKRGLLVPFGVGTIDQILLAVLQTKHVFVRLFGLANKTVIIDEVHAYDAYMSTLLERLLEWLAALGSPVIILSATLPKQKRDALIRAYLKGLGKAADGDVLDKTGDQDEYPRISYATATMPERTFTVRGIGTSDLNTKILYLEWKDEDAFVEQLKVRLKDGGCAAIICNTVDKAQRIYTQLASDPDFKDEAESGELVLDLLHARFRYKDRKEREERCLRRFGKPNEQGESPDRPRKAILVATQIVEQSLDLDFDLMISELAPADLLLQRAGRLQRHDRKRPVSFIDDERAKPTLWLLKPETGSDGLPDFGKSVYVYDKHILLRSWLRLNGKEGKDLYIYVPTDSVGKNDVEGIIEDTYDVDRLCPDPDYCDEWKRTLDEYMAGCQDEEKEAEKRWIAKPLVREELYKVVGKQEEQLEEESKAFFANVRALTRLNADSLRVICLYGSLNEAFLDAGKLNPVDVKEVILSSDSDKKIQEATKQNVKRLLYNSIPINRRDLILALLETDRTEIPEEWKKAPLLRSCRALWLDEDSSNDEISGFSIYLHSRLGLRVTKIESEEDDV